MNDAPDRAGGSLPENPKPPFHPDPSSHYTPFPSAPGEREAQKEDTEAGGEPAAAGGSRAVTAGAAAGRPAGRTARAEEVHDRLTIFVVRALFFFVSGGIGYSAFRLFGTDPVISILAACGLATVAILGEVFFSKAPVRTISAITFGLIMGLILSAVLQPVIEIMVQAIAPPDFSVMERDRLLQFLRIVTTTIFCYFGVTVLLQTKDDFKFIIPFVEFRKEIKGRAPLVLDTSAIIDGRVQALLSTGVLDQRITVPRFVFEELQAIADSPDRGRRERGRRGMDILDQLCRDHGAEVIERDLRPGTEVDSALLELTAAMGGRLVTTDYNLQKRAKLQGVTVINLNDLAAALKPAVVPGEALRVKLLRAGEDPGQAVGFLKDGTMVVVENASRRIGQEVTVEVTSAIQTQAGKMIFGRTRRPPEVREPRRDRGGRQPRGPEAGRDRSPSPEHGSPPPPR
jgi:uncharacterized protein YacL